MKCGDVSYPEHMKLARAFLGGLGQQHKSHWGPFDADKALVASVVSVLKPGKTNQTSISDDDWVTTQTRDGVKELKRFFVFLEQLLGLTGQLE